MEMTEEEFWQRMCIALAAVPSSGGPHPTVMATDSLKAFHEQFHGKAPEGTPPDVRDIRSKCTKCNAVNEVEIDLTKMPEGTQTAGECEHCGQLYTYEVRIGNT